MKTAPTTGELTFTTPSDSGFPFVLFLCVLGSLLAHAATFFLFQVVYPQRVTIPQPAPQVSLLTPSSPENIALLRWIEAEDPAVIANDSSLTPPGLAEVRYRPSFATPQTAPVGAPAEPSRGVRFPRAEDKLSVADSAARVPGAPAPSVAEKTAIAYFGPLAARSPAQSPPLTLTYHATDPVEPTLVLLGVNSQGEVTSLALQSSSGDPQLDDWALAYLRTVSFASASAPVTWGFARVTWGVDAYSAAVKSP